MTFSDTYVGDLRLESGDVFKRRRHRNSLKSAPDAVPAITVPTTLSALPYAVLLLPLFVYRLIVDSDVLNAKIVRLSYVIFLSSRLPTKVTYILR